MQHTTYRRNPILKRRLPHLAPQSLQSSISGCAVDQPSHFAPPRFTHQSHIFTFITRKTRQNPQNSFRLVSYSLANPPPSSPSLPRRPIRHVSHSSVPCVPCVQDVGNGGSFGDTHFIPFLFQIHFHAQHPCRPAAARLALFTDISDRIWLLFRLYVVDLSVCRGDVLVR
jgi:hypothetical protein